jgi:Sulfotransferase domain
MVERGTSSGTIESLEALSDTILPKRRKCRVRPARREAIAVIDQDDQNARESRSRLDLAGGRLFRPNWRLFRGYRTSSSELRAVTSRGPDGGGTDSTPLPQDVLCGGMYRACSTWQYEVAAHLIEQYLGGQRLGYLTGGQYAERLRSDASSAIDAPEQSTRWRVVKSHEGDRSFAHALAERRGLAVYAYRDVREVVFSLMHKRGMTFEQLLRQGMIHQILANDRFWMARPDVLVQRYEDLLADPTRGVIELARHIGIRLDESEAARIADLYSHESNKARTEALRRRLQEAGVDLESAANAQICDPTTLLHWNHIRQGEARSWRTFANPRQLRTLKRLCGRWLKARGYSADSGDPETTKVPVRELVRAEVDILVGRATFLIRTTSLRYPRTARTFKRILGLPVESPAGATAWADATPDHPKARRAGEPHISFTKKSDGDETDLAARETNTPFGS